MIRIDYKKITPSKIIEQTSLCKDHFVLMRISDNVDFHLNLFNIIFVIVALLIGRMLNILR